MVRALLLGVLLSFLLRLYPLVLRPSVLEPDFDLCREMETSKAQGEGEDKGEGEKRERKEVSFLAGEIDSKSRSQCKCLSVASINGQRFSYCWQEWTSLAQRRHRGEILIASD